MSIPEYFRGKKILITGASGFMGKVLVEKLLRSCPDISTIYVVIRTKKGETPGVRWSKITGLPLFDSLKSSHPNALDKVVPIPGESTVDFFGITEDHRKVLKENVNIIYHVAASVNFHDELLNAIKLNIKSTHSILELAKNMKNFECFIHVSTAYSNIEKIDVEVKEQVYDSPFDWRMMISLTENSTFEEYLPILMPKLMNGHKTTYTLTKRIAESLVEEYSEYFPAVIIRPGLVTATAADPFPGWVDGYSAFTMIDDCIRRGMLRVINPDAKRCMQFIPVDLSIRAFIIATWRAHVKKIKSGIDVYCTCVGGDSDGYSLSWDETYKLSVEQASVFPANNQLWHPMVVLKVRNSAAFKVSFFFLQVVPALLGNAYFLLIRSKCLCIKWTIKLFNAMNGPLHGFSGRDYAFNRTNYKNLNSTLHPEDKKLFSIDQSIYSPGQLLRLNYEGMVRYILNEDMSPEALKRRKQKALYFKYLHITLCTLGLYVAGSITYFIGVSIQRELI